MLLNIRLPHGKEVLVGEPVVLRFRIGSLQSRFSGSRLVSLECLVLGVLGGSTAEGTLGLYAFVQGGL